MNRRHLSLAVLATGMASLVCAQSPAPPIPVFLPTSTSSMLGLAAGQTARLNLLNIGNPSPAASAIIAVCTAQVMFLGADGNALKPPVSVVVVPGKSIDVDLRDIDVANLTAEPNQRIELRAIVKGLPSPVATGSSTAIFGPVCNLFPSLEIFDSITGRTQALSAEFRVIPPIFPVPANTNASTAAR